MEAASAPASAAQLPGGGQPPPVRLTMGPGQSSGVGEVGEMDKVEDKRHATGQRKKTFGAMGKITERFCFVDVATQQSL